MLRAIALTGKYTSTNFYVFMTQPGTVYIDDVQLFEGTNAFGSNNCVLQVPPLAVNA